MKKLIAKNRSTNEDLKPFFIKIAAYGNHNAAIDEKGAIYTWGEKFFINFFHFNLLNFKIKSVENCLGFEDCVNLNQPSLVDSLQNEKIIDVSCGENFTVVIKNGFINGVSSSKTLKNFKTTNFSNIQEKIKIYKIYSHNLQKTQCIPKVMISPQNKAGAQIKKHRISESQSKNMAKKSSVLGSESQFLNEEARKYSIVLENSIKVHESIKKMGRAKSEHVQSQTLIPIVIYDKVAQYINKKDIDSKKLSKSPNNHNPEIGMYKSEEDKILEKFAQYSSNKKVSSIYALK